MRLLVLIMLMAVTLTACARPGGDLGRARETPTHDELLPPIGWMRAKIFGEPASWFNWTDEENEMHDRIWRFLVAPHSGDWFFDILVEWQRTRLVWKLSTAEQYHRYYAVLRNERYASSTVRYARVGRDIEADLATMPGVFTAICAVEEIDRRREKAADELATGDKQQMADLEYRVKENEEYIDWFVRAARYRYDSYTYALERLLVETPHDEARKLDRLLSKLAIEIETAERQDFCGERGYVESTSPGNVVPSRMANEGGEPRYRK